MNEYHKRDEILKKMGYASYREYLRSPKWRKIRNRAMKKAKGLCKLCGDPARDVHHLSYTKQVLLGGKGRMLIALCRPCHEDGEFADGRKTTIDECNKRLGLFLKSKRFGGAYLCCMCHKNTKKGWRWGAKKKLMKPGLCRACEKLMSEC